MKKIIVWLTVVLFVLSAFKYADSRESEIYKAVYPRRMDITDVLTVNGTVRENNRKDVYSETTLCIDSVYVKEGDIVSQGDILAAVRKTDGISIAIPSEYIVNAVLRGGVGEAVYCNAEDGYIRSPMDGTIMNVNCRQGEKAGVIVPLFSVSDLGDLKISAQINEDSVHKIKEGMSADIYTNIKDSAPVKGEIVSISPYAVRAASLLTVKENPAKAEVLLDIIDRTENILPGYSVTMKLITDTKENALTIPYEYIQQNDKNEQFVYVLGENGIPETRIIETGYELENVCEVRNGIKESDLLLMCNTAENKAVNIRVKNANE